MTSDNSHKLIEYNQQHEGEFIPLPFYSFDVRPETMELTADEAATAIYLSQGRLPKAASLLKVSEIRLKRLLRGSPRLQRVLEEVAGLVVDRAYAEYIDALEDTDARRREWGATKVMQSRAAVGHLFSPAPPANTISATANSGVGEVIFHWRRRPDALEGDVIDGSGDEATGD